MTVEELIDILADMDPDMEIVLSSDPEGNSFSILRSVEDEYSFCDGEIGLTELQDKHIDQGYSEEDVMDHGQAVLVLWP